MPTESTRPLARRIVRVVLGSRDVADCDLLRRFAASRDEEAFAELVRRHGPMVFGVCRRVTRHPHDAEDAFQAAFIVLARRASHVKHPEQLANWLYGVAYRTALEARTARRRVQEQPVSAAPEPAAPQEPDDTADLRRVIDEELTRLPEKYRSAVVLCDLEGASRAEAAAQLNIPEGTLSSRLAHARKVLAQRLTSRGVTASAAAVATTLGREAVASVPRELVTLTARVASRAATGGATPTTLISPTVSSLADGVMKAMLVNRLRLVLGVIMACGLLGLGAYGIAQVPVPTPVQNGDPLLPPTVTPVILPDPVANPFSADVFAQQPTQPKAAPKVAAKGIEDDDVPFPATPTQAVVRVEEGKLIVRQRGFHYEPTTAANVYGQAVTSYQRKSGVHASTYDPADVAVFDMKGNRLQPKAWKDKLKADVHVLLGTDGRVPNPRELTLFKEDILIVVLPQTTTGATIAEGIPAYAPPAVAAPGVRYAPAQNALPATVPGRSTAPPATTRPGTARPTPIAPPANELPPDLAPPTVIPGGTNIPASSN